MKKSFKKLLLIMAVVITAVACLAFEAGALDAEGQCGDNVYWSYDSETKELVISGSGDMLNYEGYYKNNDYPVCNSPFFSLDIKSVVIEEGVTGIGEYVFWHTGITSLTLPDSLTEIADYSFYGCENLKDVIIPEGVTTIGDFAFKGCTGLTSIAIPDSTTSVGEEAFSDCKKLKDIVISDNITFIGESAFSNTGYYNNLSNWENRVLYIDDCLIKAYDTITSCNIKQGTKIIAYGAFRLCKELADITIPDSVRIISVSAFSGCEGLTSLTVPGSVRTIDSSAFASCTSLENIKICKGLTTIGGGAFRRCTGLTSITIPESVTSIGIGAFRDCDNLTSITLPFIGASSDGKIDTQFGYIFAFFDTYDDNDDVPESLKEVTITAPCKFISSRAFEDCSYLKKITISGSVKNIGIAAFENCTGLETVKIGKGVTTIGVSAFGNCTSLKSITIPDSITSIDGGAFSECTGLESVYASDIESWLDISFGSYFSNPVYYAKKLYFGKTLVKNAAIPDSVTTIGDYAFCGYTSLESITIPDSVKSIGINAFYECTGLTGVTIPVSVTSIGESAFFGCSALKNIKIHGGVTSIDSLTFARCTGLTSITIPDSVKTIGESAFSGCTGLTSVTIPDSVTTIGGSAFYNCERLTSITIPDSVTSLGNSSFYGCSALKDIKISENVNSIGYNTFAQCTGLTSFIIPRNITSIGVEAFDGCISLSSLTISDGVTSIGEEAFYGCTGLKSIVVPDSVTFIGSGAFGNCTGLKSITVPFVGETPDGTGNTHFGYIFGAYSYYYNNDYFPKSLKKVTLTAPCKMIDDNAFYNCTGLTSITIPASLENIGENAFCGTNLEYVFYDGTGEQKKDMLVSIDGNDRLVFDAIWHYQAKDHFYGSYKTTKNPTCTVEGSKQRTCSVCDYVQVTSIAKLPHTYKTVTNKATLSADGSIVTSCSVCGTKKSTTVIPKPTTFTLSTTNYTHNGSVKNPSVTVKDSKGKVLTKGTDYKVTYESGRILPGKYTVRIDFIGKYEGTKRLYFTIAPKTPGNVKTAQSASAVRLNWSKVTGASGYIIEQYVSGAWKRIATITKPDTITYRVEKLKSGTTYKFRIKAYKKDDGTIWSKATSTITAATNPAVPKSISTSQSTSAINIKWGKVTGANGYIVEQYVSGAWKRIKTVTKADTVSYKVQNLKAGTTYKFRLKAYKKVGDATLWSGATSTITVATKPATPSVTSIASPSKGKVTVRWSNVTGETGYEVYYSTSKTSGFKKIANFKADTLTASKTGLTSGKTYYFKVRAYKTVGSTVVYSDFSAVKSVKIK